MGVIENIDGAYRNLHFFSNHGSNGILLSLVRV